MALIPYERSASLDARLTEIATTNGFLDISSTQFLGQLMNAIKDAIRTDYTRLYEIADNVDIGRASGEYLTRWGNIMGEARSTRSYAHDLSLDNVEIYLDPDINAGSLTTDGLGFPINPGTIITSSTDSSTFTTLDHAYMRSERSSCFVRVAAAQPGALFVPAYSLDTLSIGLGDIEGINTAIASSYALKVRNNREINGGAVDADDALYRYILQQKSESMGLFNDSKINTVLDVEDIVRLVIHEYCGGINVYVETRNTGVNDVAVASASAYLRSIRPRGTALNVLSPFLRQLALEVQLDLVDDSARITTVENFRAQLYQQILDRRMGVDIDLGSLIDSVKNMFSNVAGVRLLRARYGKRILTGYNVRQHFNEKATTTQALVVVS